MDRTTFFIYILMYVYGFALTIWAIFIDKTPTKKSYYAGVFGLIGLLITTFYFGFVLWRFGIQ